MARTDSAPARGTIEDDATVFNAAEIQVVVFPVGATSQEQFEKHVALLRTYRHVDLASASRFYLSPEKSPLQHLNWHRGYLHFNFIPINKADITSDAPSPMVSLHGHRRVMGSIGVCDMQQESNMQDAYDEFERACRTWEVNPFIPPMAFTVSRCFAFHPTDQTPHESSLQEKPKLIMFQEKNEASMKRFMQIMVNDFAACLFMEIEKYVLALGHSHRAIKLDTYLDSAEFAPVPYLDELNKTTRGDEGAAKQKLCRMTKCMGDMCLLAGSPLDAQEHYQRSATIARGCSDFIWWGAAIEGEANALIMNALLPSEEFPTIDAAKSFTSSHASRGFGGRRMFKRLGQATVEAIADGTYDRRTTGEDRRGIPLMDLVREKCSEARAHYRKRGALPCVIELDLKLARLLAGVNRELSDPGIRSDAFSLLNGVMEAIPRLGLAHDQVVGYMGVADVMGLLGHRRKRTLLLWQAVELARVLPRGMTTRTLEAALHGLKCLSSKEGEASTWRGDTAGHAEVLVSELIGGDNAPKWPMVQCALLESIADVANEAGAARAAWDAAACLMRDTHAQLSHDRQKSLYKLIERSAVAMKGTNCSSMARGPPPLVVLHAVQPMEPGLQPVRVGPAEEKPKKASKSVMVYDPFEEKRMARDEAEARRKEARDLERAGEYDVEALPQYVCGQRCHVTVEISNPTSVRFSVDKLELDYELVRREGPDAVAEGQQERAAVPHAVQVQCPPNTVPTKVRLGITPRVPGVLRITGARLVHRGMSWRAPFVPPGPKSDGRALLVRVLPALPHLKPTLPLPPMAAPPPAPSPAPSDRDGSSRGRGAANTARLLVRPGALLALAARLHNATGAPPTTSVEPRIEVPRSARGRATHGVVATEFQGAHTVATMPEEPLRIRGGEPHDVPVPLLVHVGTGPVTEDVASAAAQPSRPATSMAHSSRPPTRMAQGDDSHVPGSLGVGSIMDGSHADHDDDEGGQGGSEPSPWGTSVGVQFKYQGEVPGAEGNTVTYERSASVNLDLVVHAGLEVLGVRIVSQAREGACEPELVQVLELEVRNWASTPMAAYIGPLLPPDIEPSTPLQAVAAAAIAADGAEPTVIPAGGVADVALRLERGSALQPADLATPEAAAARLCGDLGVHWKALEVAEGLSEEQHFALGGFGILPLPRSSTCAAATPARLAALRPAEIRVAFVPVRSEVGALEPAELAAVGSFGSAGHGMGPITLRGARVQLGEPLPVAMTCACVAAEEVVARVSVMVRKMTLADVPEGVDSAPAAWGEVLLSGCAQDVEVALAPGEEDFSANLVVTPLVPGLYQVTADLREARALPLLEKLYILCGP